MTVFWKTGAVRYSDLNRIPSGREHSIGIDGILQRFMKALQRMIVEGVNVHDGFLEDGRRSIFAPAVLAAHLDQLLEAFAVALVRGRILGHRGRQNEYERSLPETRRQGERPKQRHAEIARRFAEDAVRFNDGLAAARDDG